MLPSEITTTMEYSDPEHPLASRYMLTWKTMHSEAKEKGVDTDEKEYESLIEAYDKPINVRIKNYMRDKGIDNEDIQTVLGLKKSQTYDLIKQPTRMSREQVAKLATILDVSLAELRGEPQVLTANTVSTYYDHLTETDKAIISSLITRLHSADHGISWV